MEAIRKRIIIDLPESFKSKNAEIIILPLEKTAATTCEPALLGEASLGKDWNKTEEDKAWKNL